MTKKRTTRKNDENNSVKLGFLVGLLFFTILALGGAITHKVLTKQNFEQKIEALISEKDSAFSQESQKDHFRKDKSEIITYYPMRGDSIISPVKDIVIKDITDKVEGKEHMIFYYSEKGDS